ncbi:hypothetical protein P3X46_018467 [Hevea brasiliensis]|uniref:Tubulin-specific chaperone C N-terminal domain-containing protein n=1 Tax=Hevea brasiliensis TaxID=3981 RepID=A0ABQ9LST0_HEVBR|nr:hypothetical protein P3X46_018467 [Hevea brasiliensis]
MLDRLSKRHQTRTKSSSSTTDSATPFLSNFSDSQRSIESLLAESSKLATTYATRLKSHLIDISSSMSSLERLVTENSYFLPSYELCSSLKTVSELKQSLDSLNAVLVPKKKFSFNNKSTSKSPLSEPKETEMTKSEAPKRTLKVRDLPGTRNKENEILTKNFRGSEIGEFTLLDLDSSEERLIGCVNALFINRLRSCREVIYLRVRSRPIIEDCVGIRFDTGNWCNADDFKWLTAVQSPIWSVLAQSERVGAIVLKDFGNRNGAS